MRVHRCAIRACGYFARLYGEYADCIWMRVLRYADGIWLRVMHAT